MILTEKQQEELIEQKVREKLLELLTTIDEKLIVKLDERSGAIYIGGERADEARLSNLKAEAQFFLQSDLWKLIHETPKELAQRAMFVSSETLADIQKGKSILYTLSTQKKIVETFTKVIPRK